MQHSIQIQKQEINKILEIISTNKITIKIISFYYRIINHTESRNKIIKKEYSFDLSSCLVLSTHPQELLKFSNL